MFPEFLFGETRLKVFQKHTSSSLTLPSSQCLAQQHVVFVFFFEENSSEIFSMHGTSAQIGNGTLGNS